ncbi:MAG: S41 family peptidase [Alphaproteobacteria bacterium]
MNSLLQKPRLGILVLGIAAGAFSAQSLTGCSVDAARTPLARVIDQIGYGGLSKDAIKELTRFNVAYKQAIDPTLPNFDADGSIKGSETQRSHFRDAFMQVRRDYVRQVPDAELIDNAITGMMEAKPEQKTSDGLIEVALDKMMVSLDPHSRYLNPKEYKEMRESNRGEFGGLGIEVTMQDGYVKVIAPIQDTPAAKAGVQAGDLITHLDGVAIKGKTLGQAVQLMRGKPGTSIRLTVSRADTAPFDVDIIRAVIHVRSVKWRLEGDVGYVRVTRFDENIETGIEEALKDIKGQLGDGLVGIVLDLRSNPGGLLHQSLALSDAFLEDGVIVSVRGRHASRERSFEADSGDLIDGLPIVVLMNDNSASASEIVAGALQDHGRGIVMGQRSYGKGSVQTIMPLPVEGALKLTTQLYYSPSGRAIQARGIYPDIEIVPTPKKQDEKAAEAKPATGDEKKARPVMRHEEDMPGAIAAVGKDQKHDSASLPEKNCSPIGKKKDRTLGCALSYLHANSTKEFLASMGLRKGQIPAM